MYVVSCRLLYVLVSKKYCTVKHKVKLGRKVVVQKKIFLLGNEVFIAVT